MKQSSKILFVLALIIIIFIAGFLYYQSKNYPLKKEKNQILVLVSILPQLEFVGRIGGDNIKTEAMVRKGFNHASYEPAPDQLVKASQADLYVKIGAIAFESVYLDKLKAQNPQMQIIDSSKGINFRTFDENEIIGALHADDERGGVDPHIWLSPQLVIIQVQNFASALSKFDSIHGADYKKNADKYIEELKKLDAELQKTFASLQNKTILVYHPELGYFAEDYGLKQMAIELDGKEPTAAYLEEIITKAREEKIKVIFVQPQYSRKSAEVVAKAIGGLVVEIDPLAPNYLENMYTLTENIRAGLTNFQ